MMFNMTKYYIYSYQTLKSITYQHHAKVKERQHEKKEYKIVHMI